MGRVTGMGRVIGVGTVNGQRPFRTGPNASQAGIGVPGNQDVKCIALLHWHLHAESRDAGGGWLGLGDVMQRLA